MFIINDWSMYIFFFFYISGALVIFNQKQYARVDIPAVSMLIAHSLKTCDICGIVLCDKTAHFRVAFYCGQPKAHLCNNHAV